MYRSYKFIKHEIVEFEIFSITKFIHVSMKICMILFIDFFSDVAKYLYCSRVVFEFIKQFDLNKKVSVLMKRSVELVFIGKVLIVSFFLEFGWR